MSWSGRFSRVSNFLYLSNSVTNFTVHGISSNNWLTYNSIGLKVVQPDLMTWQPVRIVQIFDGYKDIVFPSLVGVFHDQWGIPWPYKDNVGESPTIQGDCSLSVPIWLPGAIPTKQMACGLNSLVCRSTLCLWCHRLIHIQGGHSGGYVRSASLGSVPKIC